MDRIKQAKNKSTGSHCGLFYGFFDSPSQKKPRKRIQKPAFEACSDFMIQDSFSFQLDVFTRHTDHKDPISILDRSTWILWCAAI